jgi:beta-1,4-mannosyltransferase
MRAGFVPIVIEASSTAVPIAGSYHTRADAEERRTVDRSCHGVRVTMVALGDLGRSPRICYHALALAEAGARVDLVGYLETTLDPAVARHAAIRAHPLRAPLANAPRAGFVARGFGRVVRQSAELLHALLVRTERPDALLVQNPPAVPTLAVALVAARLRRARLIVDWHNFGYAMLALRLGAGHPVVRAARGYERAFGRRADRHLVVSQAMADELAQRWGIPGAVVLPDRPAARFAPLAEFARAAVRARLIERLDLPATTREPAWVVSPMSWTPDEDVALLVEAAERYDRAIDAASDARDLLVVVTGLGPLRDEWRVRFAGLSLRRVHLRALWVEAAEYPEVVAAADLGVSVHRSTSGLDLPMKIADLQGAGVPVCALDYGPCLGEMLRPGENGLLFRTAAELAAQLTTLFGGAAEGADLMMRLRAGAARVPTQRWHEVWAAVAAPLFR